MISAYLHDSSRLAKKPSKKNFGRCRFLRCFLLAARPLQICFPVNGFGFCRKSRSQRSGQEVPVSAEACKRWQFVQPCPTLSKLKTKLLQTGKHLSVEMTSVISIWLECRHLAALAPNRLAGPEGWAHSLNTEEIVEDRNFVENCMAILFKIVFQTNQATYRRKTSSRVRDAVCVTERWDWYKLKVDPTRQKPGQAQLAFLQGALNSPMRPSFEALPTGWTRVGPCSDVVGCRWICFCAFYSD